MRSKRHAHQDALALTLRIVKALVCDAQIIMTVILCVRVDARDFIIRRAWELGGLGYGLVA